MSKSGLMLDVSQAEQPCSFLEEIALFVRVLRATQEPDRVRPVDCDLLVANLLCGDPGRVTRFTNFLGLPGQLRCPRKSPPSGRYPERDKGAL